MSGPKRFTVESSALSTDGSWYSIAVVFSVCVLALLAWLLRTQAREVAVGIAWSLLPFLALSVVVWSLVHLPAH